MNSSDRPKAKGRGAHGSMQSWWATRWLRALTQWFDADRLAKGAALARQGRVESLNVQVGAITARVTGVDGVTHDVRVEVRTFSQEQWDRIIGVLARQAMYAAQLLNGEMPYEIETIVRAAGVSLFPRGAQELRTECTCADWVKPCSHIAAVYYELGELLDSDPFMILVWRGRMREQVIADLRAERAGRADGVGGQPVQPGEEPHHVALAPDPDRFWRMGEELHTLRIHVRPPEVKMEVMRILGEMTFAPDPRMEERLERLYEQVTSQAVEAAFEDDEVELPSQDE